MLELKDFEILDLNLGDVLDAKNNKGIPRKDIILGEINSKVLKTFCSVSNNNEEEKTPAHLCVPDASQFNLIASLLLQLYASMHFNQMYSAL